MAEVTKLYLWVNGHVVVPQSPLLFNRYSAYSSEVFLLEKRDPTGIEFSPPIDGKDHWFYIPFPTPSLMDNRSTLLKLVNILVYVGGGSIVTVALYDGMQLIEKFQASLTGDHSQAVDGANTFPLTRMVKVKHGLSVWVAANFPMGQPLTGGTIRFVAAGAQFIEAKLTAPAPR